MLAEKTEGMASRHAGDGRWEPQLAPRPARRYPVGPFRNPSAPL